MRPPRTGINRAPWLRETAVTRIAVLSLLVFASACASDPTAPESPPAGPPSVPPPDPMVAVDTLHPAPDDFALARVATADYPIPPEARFLDGVNVCLDPGHGGQASRRGYKRGPTGVREAEMNLRVARYLRAFLERAGAAVRLTRDADVDVSLKERAAIANRWGADWFISLHHNAASKPTVNRTTVWYHRDVDHRPSSLDLARHLYRGLRDALALEQITGLPLKSDQLMFKNGFGVLRHARMTSALCESSFFTHPDEEQRLRRPDYNLREAYGLFLALVRYAAGGLPRVAALTDPAAPIRAGATLRFTLDDGLRGRKAWGSGRTMILADSIAVRIDGAVVPHRFDAKRYRLSVVVPEGIAAGEHTVDVRFENMFKHSALTPPFRYRVAE